MDYILKPIAIVHSTVKERVDEKWGEVVSEIHINEELKEGLKGLESFSHAMVVFYLHKATFNPEQDLLRRPHGREDMPEVGIFSQRTNHRPNPIGITSVELVMIKANIITVKGLDAIDGTPVLDIKPYYPSYDCKRENVVPEWVERLMKNYL